MGNVHTLPSSGTPEWIELQQARERRAAAEAYAAARDRVIARAPDWLDDKPDKTKQVKIICFYGCTKTK